MPFSKHTKLNIIAIFVCTALVGSFLYYFGFAKMTYKGSEIKRVLSVVSLKKDGEQIFSTSPFSNVTSIDFGDADRDGKDEMVLVVWKLEVVNDLVDMPKQKQNVAETRYKIKFGSHVAIYDIEPNFVPLWVSDVMPEPIISAKIIKEGDQKLFRVRESVSFLDRFAIFTGSDSLWSWENWRFERAKN